MTDSFDLLRFVDAQSPAYSRVVDELRGGRKRSHWMWFLFPQIAGLGHSAMAQRFAISSIEKALAYLAHPLLGTKDTTPNNFERHDQGATHRKLRIARASPGGKVIAARTASAALAKITLVSDFAFVPCAASQHADAGILFEATS